MPDGGPTCDGGGGMIASHLDASQCPCEPGRRQPRGLAWASHVGVLVASGGIMINPQAYMLGPTSGLLRTYANTQTTNTWHMHALHGVDAGTGGTHRHRHRHRVNQICQLAHDALPRIRR